MRFRIINHGWEYSDYFQGCGTSFTDFDHCVTGCGNNAKEAYLDAIDSMAQSGGDAYEHMPSRPVSILKADKVPAYAAQNGALWRVSILWTEEGR